MSSTDIRVETHGFRSLSLEWSTLLMVILLGVVAFLVLTPLALTVVGSFQLARPGQPPVYGLYGWAQVFSDPSILRALGNTVSLAVSRQLIALVVGVFLAWLIARTDLPWKGGLEFMFWISFFIPTLPVTVGWILLLDGEFGLLNRWLQALPFVDGPVFNIYSYWGIVWVHLSASSLGAKVLLLAPAFRNMDSALEESSRVCGVSTLGTLRRIVIPIMAPAILIATTLGLIRSLEAFEIELLLGVPIGIQVYSTIIHQFVTFEPPDYAPATALGSFFLVVLLSLMALQWWVTRRRNYRTVTGHGFTSRPTTLGRWRYPAFVVVGLLAIVITVVPMIMLVMGTFMTIAGYFDLPEPWTLNHWQLIFSDELLMSSIVNTLIVGISAALVGMVFYSLIAYVVVKTRFAGRNLLDVISWLPWAIPGVLLSLALLWTVFQTRILLPIYGTVYLLTLAMIIKSMPLGVQLTKSVLVQIGDELEEASRISGASWSRTYRRILIPLLMPALIVVGLLIFVSAARDISTVVLLGTGHTRTLALLSLDYAMESNFEGATVAATITVILVVVAAVLVRTISKRMGLGTF